MRARTSTPGLEPDELPARPPERTRPDRALFRLAAVLGVIGLVLVVVMEGFLHPNGAHPNNSPAAFREYAASGSFTSIHIGDFVGTMCIVLALVALYHGVARQGGWPRACATVGAVAAVVVAAVFAVQMAVDGVALKSRSTTGCPPRRRRSPSPSGSPTASGTSRRA